VVREYVGHGVGRQMHEDPQVPNYVVGDPETGPVLKEGMVIAIEPMVNAGDWRTKRDPDNWTVRTLMGVVRPLSTLAVRDGEAEVLPPAEYELWSKPQEVTAAGRK
jgi:methionyl aminopeptidase